MEISVFSGGILLKKYYPENELSCMTKNLMEAVEDSTDMEPGRVMKIKDHLLEIQYLLGRKN